MAKITYVEFDGTEHAVDVEAGWTLMEGAVKNGIPSILGDCGGALSCATCHVYIDDAWCSQTGEASEMELELIEGSGRQAPNSRLACQIEITEQLNGLILRMPETQD